MCDTSTYQNKGVIMKIMGVFLSISNMNSTINPDAAAKADVDGGQETRH